MSRRPLHVLVGGRPLTFVLTLCFIIINYFFIWLHQVLVAFKILWPANSWFGCANSWLLPVGSSFPATDRTWAPCVGVLVTGLPVSWLCSLEPSQLHSLTRRCQSSPHCPSGWAESWAVRMWCWWRGFLCEQTGPSRPQVWQWEVHAWEKEDPLPVRAWSSVALGTHTATLTGIFPVVHSRGSPFHVAQDQVPSAKEYVNYTGFNHFRYACVCMYVYIYIYIYTHTNSEKSLDVVFLSLFLFFFVFLPHKAQSIFCSFEQQFSLLMFPSLF